MNLLKNIKTIKMEKSIILISGYAGSGKDKAADYLVKHKNFVKLSFAEELKVIVAKKYNIDHALTLSQIGKKTLDAGSGLTIRQLLIKEALMLRSENPDIFAQQLLQKVKLYTNNVVISDFRYINEFEYLSKFLPVLKTLRIDRFSSSSVDSNSETELDNFKFDYKISNRTSISNLYDEIEKIYTILQAKRSDEVGLRSQARSAKKNGVASSQSEQKKLIFLILYH